MANSRKQATTEHVFASTKWVLTEVKLSRHPQGTTQSPKGADQRRRRRRAKFAPAQVTMTYVGGAEGSVTFRQNGLTWRYPGHWQILDCLMHWNEVVR